MVNQAKKKDCEQILGNPKDWPTCSHLAVIIDDLPLFRNQAYKNYFGNSFGTFPKYVITKCVEIRRA